MDYKGSDNTILIDEDKKNLNMLYETVNDEYKDNKDFVVLKQENVSDNIVTSYPTVSNKNIEIDIDVQPQEVKYENTNSECTVCSALLPDEDAYYDHMKMHLQAECRNDGEIYMVQWNTALTTNTQEPLTDNSSYDSSISTDYNQLNQGPPKENTSADSSQNGIAQYWPTRFATNEVEENHQTGPDIAVTTHNIQNILTTNGGIHEKPPDAYHRIKDKRITKTSSKLNEPLKVPGRTVSSNNGNSLIEDTDYKNINIPTVNSVVITKENEVYISKSINNGTYNNDNIECEDSTVNSLYTNLPEHKSVKCFTCTFCQNTYKLKDLLKIHIRTAHTGVIQLVNRNECKNEKSFACNVCDYKSNVKNNLLQHIRTHTGEKPFACKLCEYECYASCKLDRHMRTHTGEKPFACEFCNYKGSTRTTLSRHVLIHTGEKPFSCEFCDYRCNRSSSLAVHIYTHTGEKPYSCKLCDYASSQASNLTKHMRIHTGENPFACIFCNYTCISRNTLDRHTKTHTGEKPFACNLCEYKCNMSCSLDRHMRIHTGEKPFACEFCNYRCRTHTTLSRHKLIHTDRKPFFCNLCNYKCITNATLIRHIRGHTGEKPFACKLCSYSSTVRHSLTRHMRTHTGEKPHSCNLCSYKCIEKCNLAKHLLTHHTRVTSASNKASR